MIGTGTTICLGIQAALRRSCNASSVKTPFGRVVRLNWAAAREPTACGWRSKALKLPALTIDVAPLAVDQAEQRAGAAAVTVRFIVADLFRLPDWDGAFEFFFDRGCYHAARREAPKQYAPAVARMLASGGRGLILAGNAREPHDPGPPVVTEEEIRDELGAAFQILDLREFRFDEAPNVPERFLGWSCLVEKR
jgi:hypothetical protein